MNTTTIGAPPEATPGALAGPTAIPMGVAARYPWLNRVDHLIMIVWVLFTTLPLPGSSAVLYILAVYFSAGLILHPRDLLPAVIRSWPIFILPVLAVVSSIWAPSAADAIRKGVLLGLSGVIACYVASRLSARQILFSYFAVEFLAGVMSLINTNLIDGVAIGAFDQKNALAIHMFFLYTTGFIILLDRQAHLALRAVAAAAIPMALFLIFLSQSATTMLLAGGATIAFIVQALVWDKARRVRHMRTFMALAAAILLSSMVLIVFGLVQFDAMAVVLDSFGKDRTLTGRTYLWEHAWRIMDEHPLTGLGANGFWRPEVGTASSLLTYFHYEEYVRFSFHNSYLENGAQFGYPGFLATILVAAWGLFGAARTWLMRQNLHNIFFFALAGMIVIRSNVEIDLGAELSGTMVMLFIAGARRDAPAKR